MLFQQKVVWLALVVIFLLCEVKAYNQTYCDALQTLYDATNGPAWGTKTNWDIDADCCTWHGITCDGDDVTRVELANNNLDGVLPKELGEVTTMIYLDLRTNKLFGPLPWELGNLNALTDMHIQQNKFNGTLPAWGTGFLQSIVYWELYENEEMTGPIPPEIGQLVTIKYLHWWHVRFTGKLPVELTHLPLLSTLNIYGNDFVGQIPPEYGNFPSIVSLNLGANEGLTGPLPIELGNLQTLTHFNLQHCYNINGTLPAWGAGHFSKLTEFAIYNNAIESELPPSWGELPSLKKLWMYGMQLSGGIPPEWGKMAKLEYLQLTGKNSLAEGTISGPLPPELANCTNLKNFYVYYTGVTGYIPEEWSTLPLEDFRVFGSNLMGCEPSWVSSVATHYTSSTNVGSPCSYECDANPCGVNQHCMDIDGSHLCLNETAITVMQALKAEIDAMSESNFEDLWFGDQFCYWEGVDCTDAGEVSRLDLSSQNLYGPFPDTLTDATKFPALASLNLQQNTLSGPVPAGVFENPALLTVDIDYNDFTTLPDNVFDLNVDTFYARDNELSGPLPSLDSLPAGAPVRTGIYVDNNELNGTIPYAYLSNFKTISLTSNKLTDFPADMFEYAAIDGVKRYFKFEGNLFTGPLPEAPAPGLNLGDVFLGNNDFTGTLPLSWGETYTSLLSISNTNVTGTIPASYANSFQYLYLNDNKLHGPVPWNFTTDTTIRRLTITGNLFAGSGCMAPLYLNDNHHFSSVNVYSYVYSDWSSVWSSSWSAQYWFYSYHYADGFCSGECDSLQPCLNGATCFDTSDGHYCECADGWTGHDCSVDYCFDNDACQNDAICVNGNMSFTCDCSAVDYEGELCEMWIDDCGLTAPCQDGVCLDGVREFACDCNGTDHSGTYCDEWIDDCVTDPCDNNATCTDVGANAFECTCATGWAGALCTDDVDDCVGDPCENGATCTDVGTNAFECTCATGWAGVLCTDDVDDCVTDPCENGATCTDVGTNAFECTCATGWAGVLCTDDVDDCVGDPCENSATCADTGTNAFECTCATGWAGVLCTDDVNDCVTDPCENGATCKDTGTNAFECMCAAGWAGVLCIDDVDDCVTDPCENGATCTDTGTNAFECACLQSFGGSFCEVQLHQEERIQLEILLNVAVFDSPEDQMEDIEAELEELMEVNSAQLNVSLVLRGNVYVLVVGVTSSNRLNASEAVDNLQSNAAAAEVDTGFSDISVTTTTSADEPSDAVVAPDYTGILIAALVSGVAVAAAAIVAYSKRKIIMNSDGKTYALPV